MPERPKKAKELITSCTKGKLPNFFIYAKDKESHQVEEPNNSTMNRISNFIPDSKIKFSKTVSKFDYTKLMNLECDFSLSSDNPVIKAYDNWNSKHYLFNIDSEKHQNQEDVYMYRKIREKILEESGKEIDYVVNTLVAFLYTVRKSSAKKTLWACFGDVILENLKKNLENSGNICPICGKRFIKKNKKQEYCSRECYLESNRIQARRRKSLQKDN